MIKAVGLRDGSGNTGDEFYWWKLALKIRGGDYLEFSVCNSKSGNSMGDRVVIFNDDQGGTGDYDTCQPVDLFVLKRML